VTDEQRAQLEASASHKPALVKLLTIKDQAAFEDYRSAPERSVREAGGQRTHDLWIDQILTGGELSYQTITVDVFPSNESALVAYGAIRRERQDAFSDIYALVMRPSQLLLISFDNRNVDASREERMTQRTADPACADDRDTRCCSHHQLA